MAIDQVTPRPTSPQPFPKPALYEAIATINRDIGHLIDGFDSLRQFRFGRRKIDSFIANVEHLRARVNSELLERQLNRELKDEHHFWRLETKFEKPFIDPNDVLISAVHRLEEMAEEERRADEQMREMRASRENAEERLRTLVQQRDTAGQDGPESQTI